MAYFTSLCHLYNLSYDGNSLKLIFGEKLKFHVKIIFQNQTADYQNIYEKKERNSMNSNICQIFKEVSSITTIHFNEYYDNFTKKSGVDF